MSPTNGTQGDERAFEVATEASELIAVIGIRGLAAEVVEQGTRLLRLVATELDDGELLQLRLHYGPASRPSHVVDVGAGDVYEVLSRGAAGAAEAELWRLALATASSRAGSG